MKAGFRPPLPLTELHQTSNFACGVSSLDEWLRRKALQNQKSGASRTFVLLDGESVVCAYYALAAGAVSHSASTSNIRRNMPDPIPVMVLGRLAVDLNFKGQKLGAAMLQDAVLRCKSVAQNVGVRAMLVHAIDESAKAFHLNYGFQVSPIDPMTLMLKLV
ncbi:GNAT family N-acetyltransferase [Limnobacter sp.]|uniref:GNAT family N-acetyltransferase n=1 Tax=Limnobacter sp. TaxID=2003368 RepID=UPI00259043AE|nr:GNAT family N-acetyltransferase [Limnobacter sp.]